MNLISNMRNMWSEFNDADADITRLLYQESNISNVVGLILAILLAVAMLKTNTSSSPVYLWLGLVTATYLLRTMLTASYNQTNEPNIHWLNKFRFAGILTGFIWGSASFILFQSHDVINQSIVSFTLTGLCAGAAISYSIDMVLLLGFLLPVILSLLIRLAIEGTYTSIAMSLMVLLFLLFIIASGRKSFRVFHENIQLAKNSALSELKEKFYSRIMEMLANGAPLHKVLEAIVQNLEKQNPQMLCSILLLNTEGKALRHGAAPSLPDYYNQAIHGLIIGEAVGSCGAAAYSGKRVIVEDIQNHPNWAPYRELITRANLAACWSEPIKDSAGKVIGTFAIYHREPTNPTEKDIESIVQNAHLAGIAIERADINKEQQFASLLYQNTSESMMVTDANNIIIAVNPAFTKDTGYTAAEAIGRNPNMLSSGRHDKAFYEELWRELISTGKWQGEVWNRKKDGDLYVEWIRINTIYNGDGSVLNRVSLATDVTKKKESEDTIWRQANFDALTGLPNRHMFLDRFMQEIKKTHRADLPLALMFIDLDHFKEVNDALGHHMGDTLLKEAARRLVCCVRDSDTVAHMDAVARLGGDEFTIILGELKDIDCIERIAQRILSSLSEPYLLENEVAYVSASIGITLYPVDSTNADTLIKYADQAMYAAKRQGRNRFSYFTESMQATVQNRLRLTNDLRSALKNEQFHLLYQPIVDLTNGRITKAEALIRWQHPSNGLISPAEFIPIAEDSGLIVEIGNWVFQEAANQVALWRKSLHPDFQISINKSPVQFYNVASSKDSTHLNWAKYLEQLGLPGQSITVEITERLLLDTSNSIRTQLLEFHDAGIQVSLDDFGTGYSSMSYLKKFDIDYIKIDQSFVQNLDAQSDDLALCEAIIVMAHKLNMKVVAEGIETQQQLDLLKAAGCDFGQGYYFSRPVPIEEFEKLV